MKKEAIDYLKMARDCRSELYKAIKNKNELMKSLEEIQYYIDRYCVDMQKYYEEHNKQIKTNGEIITVAENSAE